MAVQQNRKTRSKRGMRRSHDRLSAPPTAIDPLTGEAHLYHHLGRNGYYRGRNVLEAYAPQQETEVE